MIFIKENTTGLRSLSVAKVLLDTCMWQPIQDWVVLRVGGLSYDVYVKEFGFEVFNRLFNYDDQKQSHDDDVSDSKSSRKLWQEGEEASSVKGGEEEE